MPEEDNLDFCSELFHLHGFGAQPKTLLVMKRGDLRRSREEKQTLVCYRTDLT